MLPVSCHSPEQTELPEHSIVIKPNHFSWKNGKVKEHSVERPLAPPKCRSCFRNRVVQGVKWGFDRAVVEDSAVVEQNER
ncbi:hypothetical protein D3C83_147480 [compost metagenome]